MKYSFIVAYKNRDEKRVKLFLESVQNQSITDFELLFINQGSDAVVNIWVEKLVAEYDFITYYHTRSEGFLWNKSNALNIGIKAAKGEYIIVADIDLIFLPDYLDNISKLIKPGLFLTHSVFYISESFNLDTINDITEHLQNYQYHEAFHSALVVKKEVLIKVQGYDEFYMVWGVEDDDIIRRLEHAGEIRKHIAATEINLYHQWHASVSPGKPSTWYLIMVNHLFSAQPETNGDAAWGLAYKCDDRPVLRLIGDNSYKDYVRLTFWDDQTLIFFNPLLEHFHQLKSGEVAYLEYKFISNVVASKRKYFSFIRRSTINKISATEITKKDISQFFQFFIGLNRGLMQDYFYEESSNNFLFVCIKK